MRELTPEFVLIVSISISSAGNAALNEFSTAFLLGVLLLPITTFIH